VVSNIFNTSESENHSLVPVLLKNIGVKESSGSPPPPRLVISKTMMRNQAHVVFMTESIKDQPLWFYGWLFDCFHFFLRTMVVYQNWVFDFFGKMVRNPMNFA